MGRTSLLNPLTKLGFAGCLLVVTLGADVTTIGVQSVSAQVTPGCVVDLRGMIGWWKGEESLDAAVGPNLVGTAGFASSVVGSGLLLGSGFLLNAASDLSSTTLPTVADGLTIEMWIKPTDVGFTGATQALASRWDFPSQDDSARSYFLYLDPNSNLVFETDDVSTRRPEVLRAAAPQLFDGGFHHVAATWDRTAVTLYVDGAVAATAPSQSGTLNPADATPFRLGAKSGNGAQFRYDGIIDESSIWTRALTAAEIGAIENRTSAGKCDFVPVEQAKLTSPAIRSDDKFGSAVANFGSTAVVGSPLSSTSWQFDGSVYVYTRNGPTWTEQARLVPDDPANVDFNGWAVDISEDTIIEGSYGNNAAGVDSGAAYIFARTGTTWAQQAKLIPADASTGDGIGYSVTADGDTAVVSSVADDPLGTDSGSAYVFTRTGTTWTQQAKLVPSDGAAEDNFGSWVALDDDTLVVGAAADDDGSAVEAGSAYVFSRTGTVWTEQAKLVAPAPNTGDQFGYGVAVAGDVVAVGAPFAETAGAATGRVFVFRRSGTTWSLDAQLSASDAAAADRFGYAVATNGSSIVIGAPYDGESGTQRGSVYVFNRVGSNWNEATRLAPVDNDVGDQFGISVAISGSVIIGVHNDDDAGNNSGSAYVFAP